MIHTPDGTRVTPREAAQGLLVHWAIVAQSYEDYDDAVIVVADLTPGERAKIQDAIWAQMDRLREFFRPALDKLDG